MIGTLGITNPIVFVLFVVVAAANNDGRGTDHQNHNALGVELQH